MDACYEKNGSFSLKISLTTSQSNWPTHSVRTSHYDWPTHSDLGQTRTLRHSNMYIGAMTYSRFMGKKNEKESKKKKKTTRYYKMSFK